MKNQGISLISLIITIIVIIILAAIVIFTGLGTPDSAQFSNFCQEVDNVYMAVIDEFADLKVAHAISGDYRTDEQIYLELAIDEDPKQYAVMQNNTWAANSSTTGITGSLGFQNISGDWKVGNLKLPKIRESNLAWYVTKDGQVFNANGYIYDGKTYFSASLYCEDELMAQDVTQEDTAALIYAAISGDTNVVAIDSARAQ